MTLQKLILDCNTAITRGDGNISYTAHCQLVDPLWERIMRIDGIHRCTIERYSITVEYLTGITDDSTVLAEIQSAVAQAAEMEGLFPLRGDKTPAVIAPTPNPKAEPSTLTALFGSQLVHCRFGRQTDFDTITSPLADALAAQDGVCEVYITLDRVCIHFNPRLTDLSAVKQHVLNVLEDASNRSGEWEDSEFFPFKTSGTSIITDWLLS